jgi:hypothetical protein
MAQINSYNAAGELSAYSLNEPNRSAVDALMDGRGYFSFSCAIDYIESRHPLEH